MEGLPQSSNPAEIVKAVRQAIPQEGLFAGKEWRIAAEPLTLPDTHRVGLERLGYRLHRFLAASEELYRSSVKGRRPEFIARLMEAGKPDSVVGLQRAHSLRGMFPKVIRPDLIWTGSGWVLTEIDSVPGGIGLTAWLNETYARAGFEVVGGENGMLDGFANAFPNSDVVISEESATYRPEMEWLLRRLNSLHGGEGRQWQLHDAETYQPGGRAIYRFFELFDLPNLPNLEPVLKQVAEGRLLMNPPPKSFLEEKLWLALFHLSPLRKDWIRGLRRRHWEVLHRIIPKGWIVDPAPLPYHAVLPGLEVQSWNDLRDWSQKQRRLVLKESGFSENAWGARSVVVGSDLPKTEWAGALDQALHAFPHRPHLMQEFHAGSLVRISYADPGSDEVVEMKGRVRLCPYYFVEPDGVHLRGVLATICPADKKILHGMTDAVMAPVRFAVDPA